jgi:putative zinc finger protein
MILDHARLQEMVAAFADGELPAEEKLAVEEHVKVCPDCRRELALQQQLFRALAQETAPGASPRLRRNIEQIGAPAARQHPLLRGRRWIATGAAAAVALGVAAGSTLLRNSRNERIALAADALVIREAVSDCRRVMGRNFPKKADLRATADGLAFPVRPLSVPAAGPFSTWKTTLAGAPAAGLAYRWRGSVVVQYVMAADVIRREPRLGDALRTTGYYAASAQGQGILVYLGSGSATVLVGDATPEELRQLML